MAKMLLRTRINFYNFYAIVLFLFQLTAMLVLVIVLFMICWSPYFLTLVLISFKVIEYCYTEEKILNLLTLVALMNSAMNPLIYAFLSDTFRKAVLTMIYGVFCRGRTLRKQAYTTTVANTRDTSV